MHQRVQYAQDLLKLAAVWGIHHENFWILIEIVVANGRRGDSEVLRTGVEPTFNWYLPTKIVFSHDKAKLRLTLFR